MTWGEILEYIEVAQERERRFKRDQGILIYQEMCLLSKMFSKDAKIGPVYEEFPYFSDEELAQIPKAKVRNYREMMQGYVKASKQKKANEVTDNGSNN